MKEIFDYQVVKAETSSGITNMVSNLLPEGWQPVGSVLITTETDDEKRTLFYFYQTMVKYED